MIKTLLPAIILCNLSLYANEPQNIIAKKDNLGLILNTRTFSDSTKTPKANPRNVIKMNLTPIALGCYSFQYEIGFHRKFSFVLGGSKLAASQFVIDKFMVKLPFPEAEIPRHVAINGWSVTPELRAYMSTDERRRAPHGNYIALYYRYSSNIFTANQDVEINMRTGPGKQLVNTDASFTYTGYSVGLMFGYQWLIGKHFAFDLWIIGGGKGSAKSVFTSSTTSILLTEAEQADAKAEIEKNIKGADLPGLTKDPEIITTPNVITTTLNKWSMYSLRSLGLCIGFSF
jgi:hypothetical protein